MYAKCKFFVFFSFKININKKGRYWNILQPDIQYLVKLTYVASLVLNINFLFFFFLSLGRKRKWFPIDEAIRHLGSFKPVQCSYVKLLKKEDKVPWYTFFIVKYVIWSTRGLWHIIFVSVREGKFELYAYHSFRFLIDLNISEHSNWNMTHALHSLSDAHFFLPKSLWCFSCDHT